MATLTAGSGISGSASAEGATPTIALSALTADWNQTGAFDIALNNASSELKILESAGATYYGIFDIGDLGADRTYTFPNTTGTVALTSDITGTNSGTNTGDQTITLTGDVTGSGTGSFATTIAADSVALTTDTTGNYAAGDGEAGNALTGDSATSFFSSGTIEDARLPSSMADKVITGSLAIPQGAPTVNAAGEIAVDTTDDQLVYYGAAKRVIPYLMTRCMVVENLAAADDNFPMGSFASAVTITSVWCTYSGTGSTPATITLEDSDGTAMTHTAATCGAIGETPPTAQSVTDNSVSSLQARESLRFDVTNGVSPETDEYEICIAYTINAT